MDAKKLKERYRRFLYWGCDSGPKTPNQGLRFYFRCYGQTKGDPKSREWVLVAQSNDADEVSEWEDKLAARDGDVDGVAKPYPDLD